MAYTEKVKFEKTNLYGCGPAGHDDAYTIAEFYEQVATGGFIDYDGHGHPAKDKLMDPYIFIKPSRLEDIPKDATHIIWYNK